jgi:hypothetical protein
VNDTARSRKWSTDFRIKSCEAAMRATAAYGRNFNMTVAPRVLAVTLLACLAASAQAQDCTGPRQPIAGTLAGSACPPPAAAPSSRPVVQSKKRQPSGLLDSDRTTIHIGGSIQTEIGVRGR